MYKITKLGSAIHTLCYGFDNADKRRQRNNPRLYDHSYVSLRFIREELLKVSNKRKYSTVLDVGCGSKPHMDLFGESKYVGIDLEDNHVADVNVNLEKGFGLKKTFDLVLCLDVMEHVMNTKVLQESLLKHVNTNGSLVVTTPFMLWRHGDPSDYFRFTKDYYLQWKPKGFVLERLALSNGAISWTNTTFNYFVLLLPVPIFIKQILWGVSNLGVLLLEHLLRMIKRHVPVEFLMWIESAPLEIFVVYRRVRR